MSMLTDPPTGGQPPDPLDAPEPRTRSSALRLTPEEAHAVRVAIRKVAAARGGYIALAVAIGIPPSTLYHAARRGSRPSCSAPHWAEPFLSLRPAHV